VQAKQARERLRKCAAREMRQVREQTIIRAGWVILVSTLPATYSTSELFWLYRSRWQIERLIKAMRTAPSSGSVAQSAAGTNPHHALGLDAGLDLAGRSGPGDGASLAENEWDGSKSYGKSISNSCANGKRRKAP
jgi:hypothetical protein